MKSFTYSNETTYRLQEPIENEEESVKQDED